MAYTRGLKIDGEGRLLRARDEQHRAIASWSAVSTTTEGGRFYLPVVAAGFCVPLGSPSLRERRTRPDGKLETSQPPPRALTRSTAAFMRRCRMLMAFCSSLNAMIWVVIDVQIGIRSRFVSFDFEIQCLLGGHNGILLLPRLFCKIAQTRKIVLDLLKRGENSLPVTGNGGVICGFGALAPAAPRRPKSNSGLRKRRTRGPDAAPPS